MAMRASPLLLVATAAAVVYALAVTTPGTAALPGGWAPIRHIDDPRIQELGRWALAEHVKQANDGLKFKRVVRGEQQVVAGMRYRLVIDASDSAGKDGEYRAEVLEDLKDRRVLYSFGPAK